MYFPREEGTPLPLVGEVRIHGIVKRAALDQSESDRVKVGRVR